MQDGGLEHDNLVHVSWLIGGLLGLELLWWIFWWIGRIAGQQAGFLTAVNYREHLVQGLLHFKLQWHTDHDSGDTLDKLNQSSSALESFSTELFSPIRILIRIPGTFNVLIFYGWQVAVTMIIFLAAAFTIVFLFDRWLAGFYILLNKMQNVIGSRSFDILSNIQSIKILHSEQRAFDKYSQVIRHPYEETIRTAKRQETKWLISMNMFKMLLVGCLLVYLWTLYGNHDMLDIGTFAALYMYLGGLLELFITFSYYYGELVLFKTRVQNVESIEELINQDMTEERHSLPIRNQIEIDYIQFTYEDGQGGLFSIHDIRTTIGQGEKIACIGSSGSGKTTFLKIIHGMYDNAQSSIAIDRDKTDYQFHELDLGTTLVPQEPELFSSTIRENITFGLDYTDADVKRFTDLAMFSPVIEQLPHGLDNKINEKGVNLSGGQKQRLALARALLFSQDKDIILMDESTSSVDPETEVQIYQNIFSAFTGKTFISSIHKMNLLKYFDRIIVFEQGTISDQGTFTELLDRNNTFKTMWNSFIDTQQV